MNQSVNDLIIRDFQLENQKIPNSEEALLYWMSDYVAYLIESRLEYLMSTMYRMDISEAAVQKALSPLNPEPANVTVARLIIERQKQRVFTKGFYKQEELDIEEEMKW
ncbi:MAG: hypothetical protein AAGG68_01360 [Bacteroidota bacterium]